MEQLLCLTSAKLPGEGRKAGPVWAGSAGEKCADTNTSIGVPTGARAVQVVGDKNEEGRAARGGPHHLDLQPLAERPHRRRAHLLGLGLP